MTTQKRKIIYVICAIMLLATFIFTFASISASAEDVLITDAGLDKGRAFEERENLHLSKDLDQMPKTYEAVVYVPSDISTGGTIFGNYINLSTPHINFSINSAGKPEIYIHDQYDNENIISFSTDIRSDNWVHVVVTHEVKDGGDVFKCYVNGTLTDTKNSAYNQDLDMVSIQHTSTFYIGQDFRTPYNFKGKIKDIAIYSEVLTADDVLASYNSGVNKAKESLIAYYDLSDATGKDRISDLSGNGYDVKPLYHERETELNDYAYSFAVVGDTQFLLDYDVKNGTDYYANIYNWIAENKESKKIEHVFGVGDITESNTAPEWEYAVSQFETIENAGIPYSITWGYSHDGINGSSLTNYFASRANFAEADGIGYYPNATEETRLENYYRKFNVGENKYLALMLEFKPDEDVFAWANDVISTNDDHQVIIVTHYYLMTDATVSQEFEEVSTKWDDLARNHKNVIMVLSGHIHYSSNIVRTYHRGNAGQTVAEFLINPQYMDKYYGYDSTGMVAMFYFSADGSDVRVEYVSTTKTMEAKKLDPNAEDILYGSKNQFTFTITEPSATIETEYGIIPEAFTSAFDYPFVIFDNNKNWVGASDVLQGVKSNTSAINIAKDHLAENNIYNGSSYGDSPTSVVILMRRNVTMSNDEYYNNFSQIQGTITIDLDGYTLTAPESKCLFNTDLKMWDSKQEGDSKIFPSEITVRNGNLVIHNREIVQFSANNNGAGKTFTYNFENLRIYVKGSTDKVIVRHKVSSTTLNLYTYVNCENCSIDITEATAKSIDLFDLGNKYTNTVFNIKGGSIIAGSTNYTVYSSKSASYGSFNFEESSSGSYTQLILPANIAPTAETFNDDLFFAESGTKEGLVTYKLCFSVKEYGNAPAEYKSAIDYPFIIFGSDGSFVNVSNCFYGYKLATSAIDIAKTYMADKNIWNGSSYGDSAVKAIVVMRRNVEMAEDELYNNLSQVQGEMIIDLGGFTLTAPPSKVLFPSTLKAWDSKQPGDSSIFPTEITVKNGSIIIANRALISMSIASNGNGKMFTYNFSNIDFAITGTTAEFAVSYSSGSEFELYPAIKFTNCDIDISGSNANKITLFNLGNSFLNTQFEVTGISVITGNSAYNIYSQNGGNGKLTFTESAEKGYMNLVLPNGVNPPVENYNDGALSFVKTGAGTDTVTYALASAGVKNYIPKMSITLNSDLIVNIYIPVNSTQSFTFDGKDSTSDPKLTANVITIDEISYYRVCVSLPASEAARNVVLKAIVTIEGKDYTGTWTMSIPKYAAKVIETSKSNEEITLVKDVLSYIRAAYAYFDTVDSEAIAKIDAILGKNYDDNNAPALNGSAEEPTTGLKSATYILDATPAIRFHITRDAGAYAFYVNGVKLKTKEGTDENGTYLEMDVYAYAMSETISYTINGVESGSYHINCYYTFVTTDAAYKDNSELINLVARFAKYCESAAAYRNSVINK